MLVICRDDVIVPSVLWMLGGTKWLMMICCQPWFCAGSYNIRHNLFIWLIYNICKTLSIWPKLLPLLSISCHGSVMTWFTLSNITLVGDTGLAGSFSFVSCTIHSFELIYIAPSSTTLPLYVTVKQCLLIFTQHPASVRCTTDISHRDDDPVMTCSILAFTGSCGRLSLRTCVDLSLVVSGLVTVTGLSIWVTLLAVAPTMRKWRVAPESSTSHSLMFSLLTSKILRKFWGCVWTDCS